MCNLGQVTLTLFSLIFLIGKKGVKKSPSIKWQNSYTRVTCVMSLYCVPMTNSFILCSIAFGTVHHSLSFDLVCSWLPQHTLPGSSWGDWIDEGSTLQKLERERVILQLQLTLSELCQPRLPRKPLVILSLPCGLFYFSIYHTILHSSK